MVKIDKDLSLKYLKELEHKSFYAVYNRDKSVLKCSDKTFKNRLLANYNLDEMKLFLKYTDLREKKNRAYKPTRKEALENLKLLKHASMAEIAERLSVNNDAFVRGMTRALNRKECLKFVETVRSNYTRAFTSRVFEYNSRQALKALDEILKTSLTRFAAKIQVEPFILNLALKIKLSPKKYAELEKKIAENTEKSKRTVLREEEKNLIKSAPDKVSIKELSKEVSRTTQAFTFGMLSSDIDNSEYARVCARGHSVYMKGIYRCDPADAVEMLRMRYLSSRAELKARFGSKPETLDRIIGKALSTRCLKIMLAFSKIKNYNPKSLKPVQKALGEYFDKIGAAGNVITNANLEDGIAKIILENITPRQAISFNKELSNRKVVYNPSPATPKL